MSGSGFEALIALARSPSWEDRASAARRLPRSAAEPPADVLLSLLCDPQDTAVVEAAVYAVLERDIRWGSDLILRALSRADEDLQDHLLYSVAQLRGAPMAAFLEHAGSRAGCEDEELRRGAEETLAYFHRG